MADHVKLVHDSTKSGNWGEIEMVEDIDEAVTYRADIHFDSRALRDSGVIDRSKTSLDSDREQGHTDPMNDITREEFNAKLETIEVKMDARVESVSAKIDAFVAVQAERDKRMEATLNQISTNHGEIKSSIGSMKTTMIVTAVSTVLAIVIGVAGFNAMLTSNMVASFQMGRSERALEAPQAQRVEPAPAQATPNK